MQGPKRLRPLAVLLLTALFLIVPTSSSPAQGKPGDKTDFLVTKVTPASVELKSGHGPKELVVEGKNLDRVKDARLVPIDKKGNPLPDIKVPGKTDKSAPTVRVSLTPQDGGHLKVSVEAGLLATHETFRVQLSDKAGKLLLTPWVTVTETQDPPPGFFDAKNPKLVVFVHGMSGFAGSLEDARDYWGFDFVRATLGGQAGNLFTFDGKSLDKNNWVTTARGNTADKANFLSLTADPKQSIGVGMKGIKTPGNIWGLLTHRDGRKPIVEQARMAIKQIHDLYAGEFSFGKQPQIILVTHSMGGPISRIITSNPQGTIKCGINRQKAIGLDDKDAAGHDFAGRKMADFIRNRTLCLVTHAAPHEGSPLADMGVNANNLRTNLNNALNSPTMKALAATYGFPPPDQVRAWMEASPLLKPLVDEINRDAVADNGTVLLSALNKNELRPENAHRTDGSPIPLYCFGGRSPAGGFLDTPFIKADRDRLANADPRIRKDTIGLIACDLAMKSVKPVPWGSTSDPRLDKVRRVVLGSYVQEAIQAGVLYWAMDKQLDASDAQNMVNTAMDTVGGKLKFLGIDAPWDQAAPAVIYLDQKWTVRVRSTDVDLKNPQVVAAGVNVGDKNLQLNVDFKNRTLTLSGGGLQVTVGLKVNQTTISIPTGGEIVPQAGSTFPDGEIDSDGMVPVNSSLGINLGFDHANGGSWYRLIDGPWSLTNHGNIIRNPEVGTWVFQNVISKAGPKAGTGPVSTYAAP
jgi:hypothetical protein